jgi:hypothetical protein
MASSGCSTDASVFEQQSSQQAIYRIKSRCARMGRRKLPAGLA